MTSPNPNHRLWGLVMAGVTRIYRSVHGGGRPEGNFENCQTLVLRNRLVNNKTRTSGAFLLVSIGIQPVNMWVSKPQQLFFFFKFGCLSSKHDMGFQETHETQPFFTTENQGAQIPCARLVVHPRIQTPLGCHVIRGWSRDSPWKRLVPSISGSGIPELIVAMNTAAVLDAAVRYCQSGIKSPVGYSKAIIPSTASQSQIPVFQGGSIPL